jgi:diguanylate cyclase (GGDEF)-like protein
MKFKALTISFLALAAATVTVPAPALAQAASTTRMRSFDTEVSQAKAAMMGDPEAALAHARAAISLSSGIADVKARSLAEATGQWLESEALMRVNKPGEARILAERGLATAARIAPGTKLHADLLKARASILVVQGSVQPALTDFLASHEIFRSLGETRSQAVVLQNLGSLYLSARDYDRALRYYAQANEAHSEDPVLALTAHNNRGSAFKEMGRHREAEQEFQLALAGARKIESDLLQARILSNLAAAQIPLGKLNRADATAQQGLRISQRSAVGWEPYLWGVRGQVAAARGNFAAARDLMEKAFAGVELEASTAPFRDFHETAHQVYAQTGDPQLALRHLAALKRLDDEAREVAASTSSALMAAKFDAANQAARIAQLKAERMQRDADLAQSRQRLERLTVIGVIGLITALIIFTIGFLAYRAVRRSRNTVAEANVKLNHAARHDALTGLPNRRYIRELLDTALTDLRTASKPCALMLIDLDRFKAVNDTLGHEAGDALLLEVGNRLHSVLPHGARAGRLGGDEFAAIVSGQEQHEMEAIAGQVIEALSAPYAVVGSTATIGASVGIAMGTAEADGVDLLTRNADLALYCSKHRGRGRYTLFADEMLSDAEERRKIETDLRTALVDNQFSIAYQPIVDAEQNQVVAFEALLRWQHPARGEVSPETFISIAEDAGLIRPIGEWVLRTACAEASRWPENVKLAINLSAIQVEADGLLASVVSAIAQSGLAPERLEFEVTESVYMREGPATAKTLEALKSLGVGLALDDFGTGYSSLGYLQRAEFSKIKIDRSFVKAAAAGCQESLAIIQAIVSMAHGLGMTTTAEGVETEAERRLVRELGCHQIQGFLVGRPERAEPAPAAEMEAKTVEIGKRIAAAPARRRSSRAA